jgi:hypothetical protein
MFKKLPHKSFDHNVSNFKAKSVRTYYWIWAEGDNRQILWGPYKSFDDAERKGYSKLGGNFEVVPLKTRDEAEASRIMRDRMLNDTGDIGESFQRFKHTE